MTKETYIERQAKQTGKTVEELEEIWERARQSLERLGLAEDERALKGAFRRKLRGVVFGKGGKRRTAQEFFGFVIGASRLIDWDEIRRAKALREYNRDPNNAILEGLVDESGNPLDDREQIFRFGQKVENPNFRKPLVGHAWDRKVYGMAKKEGDEEPKVFRLNLRGKTAKEWKGWKPFVPVRFLALCYREDIFYELYPTRLTKFQTDSKAKIDFEKWIRGNNHVYKLDKLEQAYDAGKDAVDKWAFVEADLDYINPNIDEDRKQRQINIADDCVGLQTYRVRLPSDFPISFSEFSRIIVMGEIQKFKRRDNTDAMAIEGYGVYPITGKTIHLPEREAFPAEGGTREEPIILWE